MNKRRTKIGKLDIHYLTGGQGDPLVIIHGGGDGARAWQQNAKELSEHYRVYVPDLPGFGHSQSMSDKFDILEFVEFIENFSNDMGLKRFNLIGHSIGGGIALHYALKYPQKVKGLVLVSSWCLGKEAALWVRFLSHPVFCWSLGRAAIGTLNAAKRLIRLFHAPFEFVNPLSMVKVDIGRTMVTLKGQTTVLLNQLSELMVPTLLVWGARDNIVPARQAHVATELIPNCQLHVFEDCGHSVYRQRVSEFSQVLTRFLN